MIPVIQRRKLRSFLALLLVAGITVFFRKALPHVNQTTVALSFLLAILAVSAVWGMTVSVLMSIAAMLAFNYFFLPRGDTDHHRPTELGGLAGVFADVDHGKPAVQPNPARSGCGEPAAPRNRTSLLVQPETAGRRERDSTDERHSEPHCGV